MKKRHIIKCVLFLSYLLWLYKVSGHSSSLHVTTPQTEARQGQKQAQLPPQPRQKITSAHIREKTCQNKTQHVLVTFQYTCSSWSNSTICHRSTCQNKTSTDYRSTDTNQNLFRAACCSIVFLSVNQNCTTNNWLLEHYEKVNMRLRSIYDYESFRHNPQL